MQIQASITRTAHIHIRIRISCNNDTCLPMWLRRNDDGSSNDIKLDSSLAGWLVD